MAVDPVTFGLIGWICGKLANKGLKYLLQSVEFNREINKVVNKWGKSMRGDKDVDPGVLFGVIEGGGDSQGEYYLAIQEKLLKREWPDKNEWHKAFVERWQYVRNAVEGPQAFFVLSETEAGIELGNLAEAVYGICKKNDAIFKPAVIGKLGVIDDKLDGLGSMFEEIQQTIVTNKLTSEHVPFGPTDFAQSGDEESLFEECAPCLRHTKENFYALLSEYSDNLSIEWRQNLFRQIVSSAWHIIFDNRPSFADKLLREEAIAQRVRRLIIPLCKASLNNPDNPISSSELKDFLDLLEDDIYFPPDTHKNDHIILIARMLRFLFYNQHHQSEVLKSDVFRQEFRRLACKGEIFWDKFFVDLYLRCVCDYILIDTDLLSIIEPSCRRYLREQSSKPLSLLWSLILFPSKASSQYNKDDLVHHISNIARTCRDIIECRWCISALLRIIPLYYCSEEELDYADIIKSLIEKFNFSVRSKYPQLQFMYLKTLLGRFVRTKDLTLIETFEKHFIRWFTDSHNRPLLSQLSHLQLEYASCLYACLQFLNIENIDKLNFGALVRNNTNLLDTKYLCNSYLTHKSDLQKTLSLGDKGTLFSWLIKYTSTLYNLYAKRLIEENHLRALQFKASSRIFQNRSKFCTSVLTSLQKSIDSPFDYHPSFYAKSTAVFTLIPRNQHIDLMRKYIIKAMKADDYSIIRNAKSIAHCLYSCYYYGKLSIRAKTEVEHFADLLAKKTRIGKSEVAKFHWAYYTGIKYSIRPIETQFLDDLWSHSKELTREINQLSSQTEEKVGAKIPGGIINTAKLYSSLESYFARILLSGDMMINPDVWNIFGTTIYDNKNENDIESFEKAAHFYYFAMCFVRSRKDYDQKYFYNWVRCKACAYKERNLQPEPDYIEEVASYLKKPKAKFFAYWKECLRPYFCLLEDQWDGIPYNNRKFISKTLSRVDWIQKKELTRNKYPQLAESLTNAD